MVFGVGPERLETMKLMLVPHIIFRTYGKRNLEVSKIFFLKKTNPQYSRIIRKKKKARQKEKILHIIPWITVVNMLVCTFQTWAFFKKKSVLYLHHRLQFAFSLSSISYLFVLNVCISSVHSLCECFVFILPVSYQTFRLFIAITKQPQGVFF